MENEANTYILDLVDLTLWFSKMILSNFFYGFQCQHVFCEAGAFGSVKSQQITSLSFVSLKESPNNIYQSKL